jgi:putative ABC transport system ATP-binding protein
MTFTYSGSDFRLHVPALRIERGEKVVVIGPSGSGKTTLLNLAAGNLLPDAGCVRVGGVELSARSDAARRSFRISQIGLVFQEFELLEYLSVRENILLPYRINRSLRLDGKARKSLRELAEAVGIADLLHRYPDRLSQGERQRVAICRALITRRQMILADEPTGNLDPRTSRTILKLMLDRAEASRATVLAVTHDHSLLERFDRVIDFEQWLAHDAAAEVSP